MIRRIHFTIALITAFVGFAALPAAAQADRTFYIDYASGSNTNNGTSKTTPWKTHPYMHTGASCTGTGSAPAYTHVAGDQFIFKGGVTWPAACFSMVLQAGGSASAQDYYGVDKTWFSGTSWTRPIFDAQGTALSNAGSFFYLYALSYITIDNFETKNQLGLGALRGDPCFDAAYYIYVYGAANNNSILIKNGYSHGYTISQANLTNNSISDGAGGVCSNPGSSTADSMTISDADGGLIGQSAGSVPTAGCFYNIVEVKNSHCHDVAQGVNGGSKIHDNDFYNISGALQSYSDVHTNDIQGLWGDNTVVYNNLIHDSTAGQHLQVCPQAQVYNNVMWNIGGGATGAIATDSGMTNCSTFAGSVAGIYNNTVDCTGGIPACFAANRTGATYGTVNLDNNHWIVKSGQNPIIIQATVTVKQVGNVTQTLSTANTQGYTISSKYYPGSSSGATVGAGVNLTSSCSGAFSSLCFDTDGAPWYGSYYAARPASGAWDAGAHQFGSQSSSQVNAPSGLTAVVQ